MKILHIHIPKNGGTFIAHNLAARYSEAERYVVDEAVTFVQDFVADAARITEQCSFITGHVPFRLVKPFVGRFDLVLSSYRDPWARTWSMYQFVTMADPCWWHLRPMVQTDVAEKFEAFVDTYLLANQATRNHQCGFLGDTNHSGAALENITTYHIRMIPVANLRPALQQAMNQHGLRYQPDADANVSPEQPLVVRPGDNPSVDAKILRWFDGDYQLCEQLDAALVETRGPE